MTFAFRRSARALLGTSTLLAILVGCNAVLDNPPGAMTSSDAGSGSDASLAFVGVDAESFEHLADANESGRSLDASPVVALADAGTIPTCMLGDKLCSGACVGVDDPLFGCGPAVCSACAVDHATAACTASGCGVGTCESGYADCDQDPTNGCETDLSTPAHCGSCNAKCPTTAPDCAPAATGFACATGCGGATPTLCANQCVDLLTSRDDCGSCSNACASVTNGEAKCASGHCGFTCDTNFHACGAACASNASTASCGARCTACPTGPNALATCSGGQCGLECQADFADCDDDANDGCEVDLLTTASSCGQCGHSCDGGTCANGACSAPPPPDSGSPPADATAPPPDDAAIDSAEPQDDAATD